MPSAASAKSLCIFGDSHIGCLKRAMNQELFTPPKSVSVEFWGADGPRFRQLEFSKDRIVANGGVRETVLAVNGNGRDAIAPEDFDCFLFQAVRMRTSHFFQPFLHHIQQPNGALSDAVFSQSCRDWLHANRYFHVAAGFAAKGKTRVFLAPSSFPSERMIERYAKNFAEAANAPGALATRVWQELTHHAAEEGVRLVCQPQDTISRSCYTKSEFDLVMKDGRVDDVHRSSEYGAKILKKVVGAIAA